MKNYILRRRYFEEGTYSTLHRGDGSKVCCVVEREWKNNEPFKSCVPEGDYLLVPNNSQKYGEGYAMVAPTLGVTVNGPSIRTVCLWHIANVPSELLGCAAPGLSFGYVKGQWGVVNSTTAFNALMKELGGEPARLTIVKD